jgi:hypothetical protein
MFMERYCKRKERGKGGNKKKEKRKEAKQKKKRREGKNLIFYTIYIISTAISYAYCGPDIIVIFETNPQEGQRATNPKG